MHTMAPPSLLAGSSSSGGAGFAAASYSAFAASAADDLERTVLADLRGRQKELHENIAQALSLIHI